MNWHFWTGRKDTGRTDEFSDETPLEDYRQYRKKHGKEKTARKEMEKGGSIWEQRKTLKFLKQEIASHIQNYRENFTPEEKGEWVKKLRNLEEKLLSI